MLVNVTAISFTGAVASAFADPFITIDPTFLAAHPGLQGGLVFSPGVANAPPAVPEPAAWTLMIAGFGIVGTALRRRAAASVA